MEIVNNIDSIYANIWRKCTEPSQKMIKSLDKSTVQNKEKDIIWLLKNLKTVSTVIDSVGNKCVNYFNSLKYFVNLIQ